MYRFITGNKKFLDLGKNSIFLLSNLCMIIEHFQTPKTQDIPLDKTFITYWGIKNKINFEQLFNSSTTKFDIIPVWDIDESFNNIIIQAEINDYIGIKLKSKGINVYLKSKGSDLLEFIHKKHLLLNIQKRLLEIGKIASTKLKNELGEFHNVSY